MIGGWTSGTGNRAGTFGALLVGYYEGDLLRFGGGVGTGSPARPGAPDPAAARAAAGRVPVRPDAAPVLRPGRDWVRPELVAEVAFAEWTSEGLVRQASFLGLRDDKDPADVVREG